jgi:hypothetical protein
VAQSSFEEEARQRMPEYYSGIDPFRSQILTGQHPFELMVLCEFHPNDKFTLLYRGTRDGFASGEFHYSYIHPQYTFDSNEADTFLARTHYFQRYVENNV